MEWKIIERDSVIGTQRKCVSRYVLTWAPTLQLHDEDDNEGDDDDDDDDEEEDDDNVVFYSMKRTKTASTRWRLQDLEYDEIMH